MTDWAKGLTLFRICKWDQNHFDTFENKHEFIVQHSNPVV